MVGQKLGLVGRLLGFGEYILDFQGFKISNYYILTILNCQIRILEGIDEVN